MRNLKQHVETNTPLDEYIVSVAEETKERINEINSSLKTIAENHIKSNNDMKGLLYNLEQQKTNGPRVMSVEEMNSHFDKILDDGRGKILVTAEAHLNEGDRQLLDGLKRDQQRLLAKKERKERPPLIHITILNKTFAYCAVFILIALAAVSYMKIIEKNKIIALYENSYEKLAADAYYAARALDKERPGDLFDSILQKCEHGYRIDCIHEVAVLKYEANRVRQIKQLVEPMLQKKIIITHIEDDYDRKEHLIFFRKEDDIEIMRLYVYENRIFFTTKNIETLFQARSNKHQDIWQEFILPS